MADEVAARIQGNDMTADGYSAVDNSEDALALGPDRVLRAAMDAADVHFEPDATV